MKLHAIALGCQMSSADAVEMAQPLVRRGFSPAGSPEQADAILISTCTVRQHAEDRALSLIGSLRPWKESDPSRVLIVAGCAAERLGPWLKARFPYVDLVVGARAIDSFPRLVEQALGERFDAPAETRAAFGAWPTGTGSTATAFLTIMRGCNYSCSYCIVPAVRGRELYRPVDEILEEGRRKLDAGARELILLGQTVNSFRGARGGQPVDFAGLLTLVDALPGVERIRFMSPHPHFVDARQLAAIAGLRAVCEQLHLPAQSGSDRLLARMRRNYTARQLLEKAALARRSGDIVLTTDIIVGFPTESDEDFEATLALVRELRPASAYCFKYSPREGTSSAQWPDDVPAELKESRLARLNELVEGLAASALRERIGSSVEVLVEAPGFGRTRGGFKVRAAGARTAGRLYTVQVTGATRKTLLGEIR